MRQISLAFFVILLQACSCRRALHVQDRFRSLRGRIGHPDPEQGDCFQPFMGRSLWFGVDGCKHDAIGSCACCGRRWLQAAFKLCAKLGFSQIYERITCGPPYGSARNRQGFMPATFRQHQHHINFFWLRRPIRKLSIGIFQLLPAAALVKGAFEGTCTVLRCQFFDGE
jgi:hypothetical protein